MTNILIWKKLLVTPCEKKIYGGERSKIEKFNLSNTDYIASIKLIPSTNYIQLLKLLKVSEVNEKFFNCDPCQLIFHISLYISNVWMTFSFKVKVKTNNKLIVFFREEKMIERK